MTRDEIITLAHALMTEHGLVAKFWAFRFDNHKTRFGVCNYREHYIGVSWPLCRINPDADIIDTIKHEIAHALTPGAMHTRIWKLQAMLVGARPETCAASHVKTVPGRWHSLCPCGLELNRYRAPVTRANARYICPQCRRVITWTDTRATVPTVAELYATITAG